MSLCLRTDMPSAFGIADRDLERLQQLDRYDKHSNKHSTPLLLNPGSRGYSKNHASKHNYCMESILQVVFMMHSATSIAESRIQGLGY